MSASPADDQGRAQEAQRSASAASRRTLYDIAHCRAGDKGDTSILSVFAFREDDFDLLVRVATAEAVAAHLSTIIRGEVTRHVLPRLCALQFVCEHALSSGVTTSTALDAHGKALSYALLSMPLPATSA